MSSSIRPLVSLELQDRSRVGGDDKVFSIGGMPWLTYVNRGKIEADLAWEIEQGGRAVCISGPSKSGKTVLCRHVLGNRPSVWVEGAQISRSADFWVQISKNDSREAEIGEMTARQKRRILQDIVDAGTYLGMDDFHTAPDDINSEVTKFLKPMIFDGMCPIFLSAPNPTFDGADFPPDMKERVACISVARWRLDELCAIGDAGFRALKKRVSDDVLSALAAHASGSPLAMQDLCHRLNRLLDVEPQQGRDLVALSPEMRHELFGESEIERERIGPTLQYRQKERKSRPKRLRDWLRRR